MRAIGQGMVWWKVMSSNRTISRRMGAATVTCSALLLVAAPTASPAPAADSRGYIDSTARCTEQDTAVVFGSTANSRVAICRTTDGDLQYRGVRVRDGAKLVAAASRSSDGAFTAANDGIDYLVTSSALVISAGERVVREEPMLDFHRPGTAEAPIETPTPTTSLPSPLPAEEGGS